jgi:hypothetical protein
MTERKSYEDLEIETAFFPTEDVVEDSVENNPTPSESDFGDWFQ